MVDTDIDANVRKVLFYTTDDNYIIKKSMVLKEGNKGTKYITVDKYNNLPEAQKLKYEEAYIIKKDDGVYKVGSEKIVEDGNEHIKIVGTEKISDRSINKVYNESAYINTSFRRNINSGIRRYVSSYLTGGRKALNETYLYENSRVTGSKVNLINTADKLFLSSLRVYQKFSILFNF